MNDKYATRVASMKAMSGASENDIEKSARFVLPTHSTIASATTITLPDDGVRFKLSGSNNVTNILTDRIQEGRVVWISAADGDSMDLVDTLTDNTDAGKIHFPGSSNRTVNEFTAYPLMQLANGAWISAVASVSAIPTAS